MFIRPCIRFQYNSLKLVKLLDDLSSSRQDTENIETDSLAQRSALSNGDLVAFLHTKSRADVRSQVLVSLLVTGVLGDEVEVLAADDERAVHLGGDNGAGEDTATNGDETSERALLVNVVALNGGLGCPEAQSDILVVPSATLSNTFRLSAALRVEEDVRLLLESTLTLDSQFGGHNVGSIWSRIVADGS